MLIGALIRFVMPLGLMLQTAGMALWSLVLLRARGLDRGVGACGLALAAAAFAGLALSAATGPHALVGTALGLATWYGAIGAAAAVRRL